VACERDVSHQARQTSFATYRWTVREYEKLGEARIFDEIARIELLNGEIALLAPISWRHFQAVTRLSNFFACQSAGQFDVSPQNPFNLDEFSQPVSAFFYLTKRPRRSPFRICRPASAIFFRRHFRRHREAINLRRCCTVG
jgi:hypothetical protein